MFPANEKEAIRETEKFCVEALTLRMSELFPQLSQQDREQVAVVVHNDMRTGKRPPLAEALSPFNLSDSDSLAKIDRAQMSVSAAMTGLGSDMFEPGAAERVIWH